MCMFFCEFWPFLTPPISYAMLLKDLLDCRSLAREPTAINDLLIRVFWVNPYMADNKSFIGISIRLLARGSW